MTTNKETAAYVAASITVSLGFKTLLEAVKSWEQVYDAVIEKMGVSEAPTNHAYSPSKTTDGGRKFPITSQEEIQEKIAEVFIQKGRDNRWAQKEKPKRPAFKAVDEKGNDIKDENGKSMSFWGAK